MVTLPIWCISVKNNASLRTGGGDGQVLAVGEQGWGREVEARGASRPLGCGHFHFSLYTYYILETVLGAGNAGMKMTDKFMEFIILTNRHDKQANTIM